MKRDLAIFLIATITILAACKQKKEPVKVEVSQQDTVKVEVKQEPVAVKVVKEPDRGVHLDDQFFLIFNSYTVEEFAMEWSKRFKKKGFKPAIVMRNDNGYHCLALESYNNFKDAKAAMLRLRKEPGLEDVWIMVK